MKNFYEKHRDDAAKLMIARNDSHVYPAHFHINMEIFIIRKGEYDLTINETQYHLTSGCIAIIDSYDIHSFDRQWETHDVDDCVLNIPFSMLTRFYANKGRMQLASPIIQNEKLCEQLLYLIDEYLIPKKTPL